MLKKFWSVLCEADKIQIQIKYLICSRSFGSSCARQFSSGQYLITEFSPSLISGLPFATKLINVSTMLPSSSLQLYLCRKKPL